MSHDWHEKLPGYSPDQILIDGCAECEARAKHFDRGISTLDPANFARAWERAEEHERRGLGTCSNAEYPLLAVLAAVQIQLDRRGIIIEPLAEVTGNGEWIAECHAAYGRAS